MAESILPKSRKGIGGGYRAPAIPLVCHACGKPFLGNSLKQIGCCVACKFAIYQNKGAPDECWEWTGPLVNDGYGVLFLDTNKLNGRRNVTTAHRYSYIQRNGELTADKPCVLHSCDNPKCTNPAHLRAGTRGENNAERSAKGRSGSKYYSPEERARYSLMFRGEGGGTTKLTEAQAKEIKYGHKGLKITEIASMYGVSDCCIGAIRSCRTWKHI